MPGQANRASAEFDSLYRDHFAFVWRTLRRFGVGDAALEDAAQEVFLVAYRRTGAWLEWSSPRAWLFGVARRVAKDHRRSRERHERKLVERVDLEAPRGVDQHVEDHQRLRVVGSAIDSLSADRRSVYVLCELEDMSAPEIAQALEINLNTVYSRLNRARRDVAEFLGAAGMSPSSGKEPS
jgi:RNA polymerase sigma-70 factor (ECF subfamily)